METSICVGSARSHRYERSALGDQTWVVVWGEATSDSDFTLDVTSVPNPLECPPTPAWVTYNRLRASVGRLHFYLRKGVWGLQVPMTKPYIMFAPDTDLAVGYMAILVTGCSINQ